MSTMPDPTATVSPSRAPTGLYEQIETIEELRLVYCGERGWANFHDVFAAIREPDWQVRDAPIPTWRWIKHRMREVLTPR